MFHILLLLSVLFGIDGWGNGAQAGLDIEVGLVWTETESLYTERLELAQVTASDPQLKVTIGAPPLETLKQFEALMIDDTGNTATANGSYGGGWWCGQYANYPSPNALFTSDLTYYDAGRVFYQIAEYTKDEKWLSCAKMAIVAYRDGYLNIQPTHGSANGYTLFPKGLYLDWIKTQDPVSKQAIIDLANNASFSNTPFPSWLPGPATIREMSYNLEAKLYANDVGQNLDYSFILGRLKLYWAQMLWMLQNQTSEGIPAYLTPDPLIPGDKYVRPFMVGVSAEALIEYWLRTKDSNVLQMMMPVLELMWQQAYDANGSMYYTVPQKNGLCPWTVDNSDQCNTTLNPPQYVLNMLIAPAYMWVFNQTGDTKWRDRADAMFNAVVKASYQTGYLCCPQGKGFNQVMKWFAAFFEWRGQ